MARRTLFTALVFVLSFASAGRAQVTGSIAGTVRDASGAVLRGAVVTITGPALQREQVQVSTAADGTYRAALIPPGAYTVIVTMTGFRSQQHDGIEVALNRQSTVDMTLAVQGGTESIQVTADLPLVDRTRSDVSTRVAGGTIGALPLNGRNFTDLIALVPGAKLNPGAAVGGRAEIFGERAAAMSYLVDGAENNDPLSGGALLRFTQDSIKEFEVITTGYQAEFGRAQGGVANIVTQSGTNALRGRAVWFTRHDRFDATNIPAPDPLPAGYVRPEPPALERHQWGGTLGGPIVSDRAFFFGSFERLDERRGLNLDASRIPAFVRQGIATPGGIEDFAIVPEEAGMTGLAKADVNLGAAHRLTGSFNRSTLESSGVIRPLAVQGLVALPSAASTTSQPASSVVLRETAMLGSRMFLESTGTYVTGETRTNEGRAGRAEPILLLLRSGFLQTGAPAGGRTGRQTERFQVAQTLSWSQPDRAGDHWFKFGWDVNRVTLSGFDQVVNDVEYSAAFLDPDQHGAFAESFARYGFAQSAARFFFLSSEPDGRLDLGIRTNDLALFGQDTWQVRSDVTINAGLRYDYSSLFGGVKNALAPRLGLVWDVGGTHRTTVKLNYGRFFDRNLLAAAATVPEKGGIFTKTAFDVALPRLGVDYTDSLIDLVITSGFPVAGGGRGPAENPLYQRFASDLRADPLALYRLLGIDVSGADAAPVVTADSIQRLSGLTADEALARLESRYPGTDWRFFDVPGGSLVGDRVLSFFPRGPLEVTRTVSRYSDDRVPSTHAFSAGVEQQLGPDVSVSAMFVHRRTRDLLARRIVNLFDAVPGDANFGRTIDGGPQLSAVTYDGLIDYDGIVLSVRKRLDRSYELGLAYTGARTRDNLLTGNVGTTFGHNNHPERDYGPSNQSSPHSLVASGIALLPYDVTISGIAVWRSGSAFNPRGIVDGDGDGLVDHRDMSQPRNVFRVKPYASVDLRAEKRVTFGRHAVSVLVEAFNAFNRDNVADVTAVSGPDFGQPIGFFPGREVQFGIRYEFGPR
jgi:outer membrane receptor protein involved in Fe transport